MIFRKILYEVNEIFKKSQEDFKKFQKISYSQSGEDVIIDYIFSLRRISKPTYLDLGANHPFNFNNTFLFYNRGSRGVNIDANPKSIKQFEYHRPFDVNINVGVGNRKDELDFYVFDYDPLSTFSVFEAEKLQKSGSKLIEKLKIEIKDVNTIISEYCKGIYPDLVSIDIEGLDEIIIKALYFDNSKPKVLCVETVEYTPNGTGKKNNDLIQMVVDAGFTVYADTNINTIFVENNFWFEV